MMDALRITATLRGRIAGNCPHLDALVEWVLSLHQQRKPHPGAKLDRSLPCVPEAMIPIPMQRRRVEEITRSGEVRIRQVALCSSPIMSVPECDEHDYVNRRLDAGKSRLLREDRRTVVATTNGWAKSYRLPLRTRLIDRVVWFAMGDRRELLLVLRRVKFLGKRTSFGYGEIDQWTVDRIDDDYSWFASHPATHETMLMRVLPKGDHLPQGLTGYREDFGACTPPYWHPDRYGDIVIPC